MKNANPVVANEVSVTRLSLQIPLQHGRRGIYLPLVGRSATPRLRGGAGWGAKADVSSGPPPDAISLALIASTSPQGGSKFYRYAALMASSALEPGQSSASPSAFSGAVTVFRWACRSLGSLSM